MSRRILKIFSFLLVIVSPLLFSVPAEAAIDSCFPFPAEGANAERNVASVGKGIDLFCVGDSALAIVGGVNATAVTLTFAGGDDPPACDPNEPTPDPGLCGFVVVDTNDPPDGVEDTLRVFYTGLLPPGDVTVDVQNLGDADPATDHDQSWMFIANAAPPRTPAAVELVFDVSGSMGWPAVPGGSILRLDALQSAVGVFFDLYEDYAIPGDEVGAIYFNQAASAFDAPPGSNLKAADDPTELGNVETDLLGQGDGGSTSIGAGLELADSPTGFDTTTARKFVLLFSDGEQNRPPDVSVAGSVLQVGGVDYDANVTVCPITAGRMAAPGFALQQQIADADCDGHNAHISDGEESFVVDDLETFFLQDLADILVGDKLEMVRDVSGRIRFGETLEIPFLANPDDIFLSFLVSWRDSPTASPSLPFELVAPDGTVIELAGHTRFRPGASFTTLRLPVIQGGVAVPFVGEWRIRLRGDDLPANELEYHVAVLLDNTTLATEFAAEVDDPGTGEPIPLRVRLSEAGAPVSGATVRARLVGPEEGLGEILSDAPAGKAPVDSGDNPVANGKLFGVLTDAELAALLAEQDLGVVDLLEDEPGVYRGDFNNADEEGHYHFVFEVAGNAPRNQDYQRTRRLSVFVRPKPDPARTDLVIASIQPVGEAGQFAVTVHATPRDQLSNRIGPGYIGHLRITASSGIVQQGVTDLGNGTYQTVLLLGPGEDPKIGLEVLDEEIESDDLSDLGGESWPPRGVGGHVGRWSFHLGGTNPHGPLGAVADDDWSLGLDRRFPLFDRLDLEIYLGHDRFDPKLTDEDLYYTLLTGRVRYYFGGGSVQPSIFAGIGPFLDSEDDLFLGVEVGAALEFPLPSGPGGPQLALELSYAHRNVDNQVDYGLAQLGLLVDF